MNHPLRHFALAPLIRSSFERVGRRAFRGHAASESDPSRKFAIEIFVDGLSIMLVAADSVVEEPRKDVGVNRHGFYFMLPEEFLTAGAIVEARLANQGLAVGAPIALDEPYDPGARLSGAGALRWMSGLRFSGWIDTAEPDAMVTVIVDGVAILRVRAAAWSHSGGENSRAVRAFDVHLPERFGDGAVHIVEARDERGESLAGSPLAFLAFAKGLDETMLADGAGEQNRARAEMFNRLMPGSVPFADYEEWRRWEPPPPAPKRAARCAIILVGAGDADATLESLGEAGAEWIAAALPVSSGFASFDPDDLLRVLEEEDSELVLFALAGTVFSPHSLSRLARAFEDFPKARAVYADFDAPGADGEPWPVALPAFDYERLLEQGYCALLFALRRDVAMRAASRGAADLHQLFLGALDGDPAAGHVIVHCPGALAALPAIDARAASVALARATRAHLLARGFDVAVEAARDSYLPSVRVRRPIARRSVTIIIPTRNQPKLLRKCLASLRPAARRFDAEVMIVDNDSSDAAALTHFSELRNSGVTVLRVPGPFNFSRLNNLAADAARGDVLCLINDDVEARDSDWLGEMLGRLTEPDVGAVGALLLWPSGVVQHGGVVFGPKFEPAHCFRDRMEGDPGYAGMLSVARECGAVTAACLATRRRDYLAVGGMDELRFPVNFNDADYCLKLRASGKRIVFTPHARLLHHESVSRGSDRPSDRRPRYERELRDLRLKWGDVLRADPYYSPTLALDGNPYSALASPPRSMAPRLNSPPVANKPPAWL